MNFYMPIDFGMIVNRCGLGLASVIGLVAFSYLIHVVAYWKMFTKAGESGWKSLIPVYNVYTCFKIAWSGLFFWLTLVLIAAAAAVSFIAPIELSDYLDYILIGIVFLTLLIQIIFNAKLSKAFGHGFGYTIGLLLIPELFLLIIGLGASEYVRKPKK